MPTRKRKKKRSDLNRLSEWVKFSFTVARLLIPFLHDFWKL
jgi:hypothetical protein